MKTLRNLLKDTKGATAIEYGLIAALVAIAAIGALGALGSSINLTFGAVSAELNKHNQTGE